MIHPKSQPSNRQKEIVQAGEQALALLREQSAKPDFCNNRPAFVFCRAILTVGRDVTPAEVLPIARQYHAVAESEGLMVDNAGNKIDFDLFWLQVEDTATKTVCPIGANVDIALRHAKSRNRQAMELNSLNANLRLLANVCFELQNFTRDEPFFLSGKDAGRVVGMSRQCGDLFLRKLCREGILRKLDQGYTGHASTYFYIGGHKHEKR